MKILVTGASGYLGSLLTDALSEHPGVNEVIAVDVRPPIVPRRRAERVREALHDVRSAELGGLIHSERPSVVCHLASIVTPGKTSSREFEYSVDVLGTRNVLDACVSAGVGKIMVSSSGAAYGYHPDSPAELSENSPLRGNPEFAYSDHKRIVEEMLEDYRKRHPELKQLILRLSTIVGRGVNNQITALFERPFLLGISGSGTPFSFIWDQDVVSILTQGCLLPLEGIYNVAGDGSLTLSEIARLQGKPHLSVPAPLLGSLLGFLKLLNLTRYGPEQVRFLRYRPVLSNQKLRRDFPGLPTKSSKEAFLEYWTGRSGR